MSYQNDEADNKAGKKLKKIVDKRNVAVLKATKKVVDTMDVDGDGKVDSADLIMMALKLPGVKVDREAFLRKELYKYCSENVIDTAIKTTPANARIDPVTIDKIANDVIAYERNMVSGISALLGAPGGVVMVATIPADVVQYYGYMLRTAQKLLYLYGFKQLEVDQDGANLDSGTINELTICLGIMYGIANANNAIKAIAKSLSIGVEKKILKTALTKGAVYPIVKEVAKWFGVRMTKEVFAGFFKKSIPVAGGVIAATLTFTTFKPCCIRLKDALKDTRLSNPNHIESFEEKQLIEDILNGKTIDDVDENGDNNSEES